MAKQCDTCKFWLEITDLGEGLGKCRRYPPTPVGYRIFEHPSAGSREDAVQPVTAEDDVCGEYVAVA